MPRNFGSVFVLSSSALLLLGGLGLCAQQQKQPPANDSKEELKLRWEAPCSIAYTDGKPYDQPVPWYFCDSRLTQQPISRDFFNRSMDLRQQKEYLKTGIPNADTLYRTYERDRDALLSEAAPTTLQTPAKEAKPQEVQKFKTTLEGHLKKINSEGIRVSSNFLIGAKQNGTESRYLSVFQARINELKKKLAEADKLLGVKHEEQKSRMEAKFDVEKGKGTAGALSKSQKTSQKAINAGTSEEAYREAGKVVGESGRTQKAPGRQMGRAAMPGTTNIRGDRMAGGSMVTHGSQYEKSLSNEMAPQKIAPPEHAPAKPGLMDRYREAKDEHVTYWKKNSESLAESGTRDIVESEKPGTPWYKSSYYKAKAVTKATAAGVCDLAALDKKQWRNAAIGAAAGAGVVVVGAGALATAGVVSAGTAGVSGIGAGLVQGGLTASTVYGTTKATREVLDKPSVGTALVAASYAVPIPGTGKMAGAVANSGIGKALVAKAGAAAPQLASSKVGQWVVTKTEGAAAKYLTKEALEVGAGKAITGGGHYVEEKVGRALSKEDGEESGHE